MTPLAVWWTLLPLGAPAPPPGAPPGSGRGEEFGKTSPIALVVVLLLGLATALLIRSMSKRLRNVPESFDTPSPGRSGEGAAPAADGEEATGRPTVQSRVDRTDGPPGTGSP